MGGGGAPEPSAGDVASAGFLILDAVERALLAWAREVDALRVVLLVGSRATAPDRVDALSDYDVLLFLRDPAGLEEDDAWLRGFGPILVMLRTGYDFQGRHIPTRLVQYADGRRIDFSLCPLDLLQRIADEGHLPPALAAGYRVLVDRDGLAARLPPPAGRAFVPPRPSPARYAEVVNEFWWETLYVAKNLARGELLPARFSAERVLRFECLLPMLEWYVEGANGWTHPLHFAGRGLRALLAPADAELLDRSCAGAALDESWGALFAMAELFDRAARAVAADLGCVYPEELAARGPRSHHLPVRIRRPPA